MEDRELLVLEGPPDGDVEYGDGDADNLSLPGDKSCLNLVYLAALVAAIGGLLFGYDVGIITGAKLQVAHDLGLTCAQEQGLTGSRYPTRPDLFFNYPTRPVPKFENDRVAGN